MSVSNHVATEAVHKPAVHFLQSNGSSAPQRLTIPLYLLLLLVLLTSMYFVFSFTAEDAFITYRYSENLVDHGALVYNQGEPINAMTSPLHALLSAALYLVTRNTMLSNKLVALALLLSAALLVWQRFRGQLMWQLLTLVLVLLPPSVLLWTFGGLETPLLLFLVTLTVVLVDRIRPDRLSSIVTVCVLAGLAFLTRYDASLFFAPLVLHVVLKARSASRKLAALATGAILPVSWLAVSVLYYGDVFPTSFYVKTPNGTLASLMYNGQYVATYMVLVGIVPVLLLAACLLLRDRRLGSVLRAHFRQYWWLQLGLALELLYGLSIATHHMMFSFRFFVPYLPVTAWLAVDLLRRAVATPVASPGVGRRMGIVAGMVVGLALFQGFQTAYTYTRSVNGLALLGEYRALGVRDYVRFMQILHSEAVDIEQHWAQHEGEAARQPRIITFAAGMLPYTFKDTYIYEQLVSYRHCFERHQQARFADYIHILAPRLGSVAQQLPEAEDHYVLVSNYEMTFDGSPQSFLVYFNPAPEAHNLSAGISDHCRSAALPGSQ